MTFSGSPGGIFPRLLTLLIGVIVSLTAASSWAVSCPGADQEALAWLDKMSRSVHEVSYNGVVTFQRGNEDMQVIQVSHSVEGGTSSEQMTQLTGQGAQVVRVDHPLHCIHPGHKLLRVGADLNTGDCGIASHYRFSVADGERVAGRTAVRIQIKPLDMYRYGYIMDLDRNTGLLLKTQTVHPGQKRVLEKFQFADLSYTGRVPNGAEVNLVHEAQHPHPDQPAAPRRDVNDWTVGWVPAGFAATDSQSTSIGRKTYTDGLAVFSVFIEELGRGIRPGEGVARQGSTISYTRGMNLTGQPVLVTVVGEVPINTARMVADSVNWLRANAD